MCFNSRAPRGARRVSGVRCPPSSWFQFTRPAWGATVVPAPVRYTWVCFNSRAPRGARRHQRPIKCSRVCFNSRAPRGARPRPLRQRSVISFVSIHAPRVGRDRAPDDPQALARRVSIHAPRVGRDAGYAPRACVMEVSIHAPRVGRDIVYSLHRRCMGVSIHAPRVGRDRSAPLYLFSSDFVSIHAPRVGRDLVLVDAPRAGSGFQFTRPAWGATELIQRATARNSFNSRAPRGARHRSLGEPRRPVGFNSRAPRGARRVLSPCPHLHVCFNSRAPRGARPVNVTSSLSGSVFQFTRPAWGATLRNSTGSGSICFNSRAPRGARPPRRHVPDKTQRFNSRAPRGARPRIKVIGGGW